MCLRFEKKCSHKSSKSKFKCNSIPLSLVIKNRRNLYKNEGKVQQDIFLSRLITPYDAKRRGNYIAKNDVKRRCRNISCQYHLFNEKKRVISVCKSFFIKVFGLTKRRLENLSKTLYNGQTPAENRGGNRYGNRNEEKKQSLRKFLNELPAQESHYGRQKSRRIYLSSEYNAMKLWKHYNMSVLDDLKIKKTCFIRFL